MVRSKLLASAALAGALALVATPALAVYTGINVTGGNAQEIQTITISIPGNPPVTAQKSDTDEKRKLGFWYVDTSTGYTPGAKGTATITMMNGDTKTVPVRVGSDGTLDVSNSRYPGILAGKSTIISLDYSHFFPNIGSDGDAFGGTIGSVMPTRWNNISVEGGAGYTHVTGGSSNVDAFNLKLVVPIWCDDDWEWGPTFGYQNATGFSTTFAWNYGAFAEYYGFDSLWLQAKVGGFNYSGNNDGYYAGGGLSFYPCPDLGLNGTYDYTQFNNHFGHHLQESDYTARGEWLFSQDVPVAFYVAYQHESFATRFFHVDTVMAGFTFFLDDIPGGTLEARRKFGPTQWVTNFAPLSFKF